MITTMNAVLGFLSSNSAFLVAVLALAISLRANYTAHQAHKFNLKSKADADRVLLLQKKRELLNEVDHQHARFATLMMLTAQKILLFREHPELHDTMQEEFIRLKANLNTIQNLAAKYDEQRSGIEAITVGHDIASQEELLANIRRLTIQVDKDILHEMSHLGELRLKVGSHGGV
jgi:hypothetical protein